MQNDKDSTAMNDTPPSGDNERDERDRDRAAGKGSKVPASDGSTEEDTLEKTGQPQGQSRGKPQTQPQE